MFTGAQNQQTNKANGRTDGQTDKQQSKRARKNKMTKKSRKEKQNVEKLKNIHTDSDSDKKGGKQSIATEIVFISNKN